MAESLPNRTGSARCLWPEAPQRTMTACAPRTARRWWPSCSPPPCRRAMSRPW